MAIIKALINDTKITRLEELHVHRIHFELKISIGKFRCPNLRENLKGALSKVFLGNQ